MTAESVLTLEKISTGKSLYKFAWTLEIIAAVIGLLIAYGQAAVTYELFKEEFGTFPIQRIYDLMLAGLPFVMVASVELLKIPFCKVIYLNKAFKIRFLFSIVLIVVTLITFETFSQGFESNFNNITMKVSKPQKKLKTVNQKMQNFEEQILKLQQIDEESISNEVSIMRSEASKSRDSAIDAFEKQISNYQITENKPLIDTRTSLEKQIERAKDRREELISQTQKNFVSVSEDEKLRQAEARSGNNQKIKTIKENIQRFESYIEAEKKDPSLGGFFGNKVSSWEKQIAKLQGVINKLVEENTRVGLGSSSSLNTEINRINTEAQIQIDSLYDQINEIDLKIAQSSTFKNEIKTINVKILATQNQYNEEINVINKYRKEKALDLNNKSKKIDNLESQLVPLKDEQTLLEIIITDAYELTPIYRYARGFYGLEEGVLISEKQISRFAAFWYGSIALIVSTMGIFLAFASFIFMYSGIDFEELKKDRKPGPFRRALINMMESRKKRYDNPEKIVKVIKEVPVEKIVKEIVEVEKVIYTEVPKEVIKKEVIHVPIYTNDPDLIKFGTTKVKDIMDDE